MARRLVRNTEEGILGGVAAGVGDYLEIDPVLIRLLLVILCFVGGSGLIVYVVAWLLMPASAAGDAGAGVRPQSSADHFVQEVREVGERVVGNLKRSTSEAGRGQLMAGLLLICMGCLFLLNQVYPLAWFRLRRLWPLVPIVLGLMLISRSRSSRPPRRGPKDE